jgi:carboxyl-terminal processing protease
MAVLVDGRTSGAAEWLAAALQDHGRAVVIGSPTSGHNAGVQTTVPLGDGSSSIRLTTGLLERGDGRPIGNLLSSFGIMPRQPSPRSSEATKAANLARLARELDRRPLAELRTVPRRPDPRMGPLVGVMPDRAATGSEMDEALELALDAYREGPSDETRDRLRRVIARLPGRVDGDAALEKAVPLLRLLLKPS